MFSKTKYNIFSASSASKAVLFPMAKFVCMALYSQDTSSRFEDVCQDLQVPTDLAKTWIIIALCLLSLGPVTKPNNGALCSKQ